MRTKNLRLNVSFSKICVVALSIYVPVAFSDDNCFCLVNNDDQVWFDCVEARKKILCLADRNGKSRKLISNETVERVAAGEGVCQPCRFDYDPAKAKVRGDENQEMER